MKRKPPWSSHAADLYMDALDVLLHQKIVCGAENGQIYVFLMREHSEALDNSGQFY